jgi:transcription antitermination factor NusG
MLPPSMSSIEAMSGSWDICQTYVSHEKALAWRLLDAGIGYFLPLQEVRRTSGDRDRRRVLPCFPGYIFLRNVNRWDVRDRLRRLHRRDVLRFIDVISASQAWLHYELETIHYAVSHRRAAPDIKRGDRCRVVEGPFEGMQGFMDREGRRGFVMLNVSMLGQGGVPFEIEVDRLEKI